MVSLCAKIRYGSWQGFVLYCDSVWHSGGYATKLLIHAGELGQLMDSFAIATDFQKLKVCSLSLQHALEMAGAMQGNGEKMYFLTSIEIDW